MEMGRSSWLDQTAGLYLRIGTEVDFSDFKIMVKYEAVSRSVIILGHFMDSCGVLDQETIARIRRGIEVYDEGAYTDILLCGWAYRKDIALTLAEAMYCYIQHSFPEYQRECILQPLSRDTVGDAFFSKLLLDHKYPHAQHRATIVTSEYHADRSTAIFRFIFGEDHDLRMDSIPHKVSPKVYEHEQQSLQKFRETFGMIEVGNTAEIYDRMSSSHSLYNGEAGPQIEELYQLRATLSRLSLAKNECTHLISLLKQDR